MIIIIISFHQSQVFTKGLLLYYLNLEVRHLSHLLFVDAKDFLSLSQPSGYAPSVMALWTNAAEEKSPFEQNHFANKY